MDFNKKKQGILKKSLECLESWCELEVEMLTSSVLVNGLLKHAALFTPIVCEILMKFIKNSDSSNILARNQLSGSNDSMPATEKANVESIIRII